MIFEWNWNTWSYLCLQILDFVVIVLKQAYQPTIYIHTLPKGKKFSRFQEQSKKSRRFETFSLHSVYSVDVKTVEVKVKEVKIEKVSLIAKVCVRLNMNFEILWSRSCRVDNEKLQIWVPWATNLLPFSFKASSNIISFYSCVPAFIF